MTPCDMELRNMAKTTQRRKLTNRLVIDPIINLVRRRSQLHNKNTTPKKEE